jgi:hypothetical protein
MGLGVMASAFAELSGDLAASGDEDMRDPTDPSAARCGEYFHAASCALMGPTAAGDMGMETRTREPVASRGEVGARGDRAPSDEEAGSEGRDAGLGANADAVDWRRCARALERGSGPDAAADAAADDDADVEAEAGAGAGAGVCTGVESVAADAGVSGGRTMGAIKVTVGACAAPSVDAAAADETETGVARAAKRFAEVSRPGPRPMSPLTSAGSSRVAGYGPSPAADMAAELGLLKDREDSAMGPGSDVDEASVCRDPAPERAWGSVTSASDNGSTGAAAGPGPEASAAGRPVWRSRLDSRRLSRSPHASTEIVSDSGGRPPNSLPAGRSAAAPPPSAMSALASAAESAIGLVRGRCVCGREVGGLRDGGGRGGRAEFDAWAESCRGLPCGSPAS